MGVAITTTNAPVLDGATATTNWLGVGDTPAVNTDLFPPGASSCLSLKFSNEIGSLMYNAGGTGTYSSGSHVGIWYNFLFGSLATRANGGIRIRLAGSTSTNYVEAFIGGSDDGKSGWQYITFSIDRILASPDATGGTPPTAASAIQYVGVGANVTANVGGNNDNFCIGAITHFPAGSTGLRFEGTGTGSSGDFTWDDMATAVRSSTSRGQLIKNAEGVFILNAPIEIGDTTASSVDTNLEDTNVVIAWGNNEYVEPEFYGITVSANSTDTVQVNAGTKLGTGDAAVGVSGWTIITGGPRWYIDASDSNITFVGLYGCAFQHSSTWAIDHPGSAIIEVISCVFSDCDTIALTGHASAGTVLLSNFFSNAPGPLAQIQFQSGTGPYDEQFNFNGFANMSWFAIEIPDAGTFSLRGVDFTNNGTDRDILLSHDSGVVTINVLEGGDTPGVSNGSKINITMTGSVPVLLYTIGGWLGVSDNGQPDFNSQDGVPMSALADSITIDVDSDTFSVAAAWVPLIRQVGVDREITFSGSGDDYEDHVHHTRDIDHVTARIGYADELTPSTAQRTSFPVHAGTETEGVQALVEAFRFSGGTPVTPVGPVFAPWRRLTNVSSVTGIPWGLGDAGERHGTFLVIVAQDTNNSDVVVSSVTLDNGTATPETFDAADVVADIDDNTGSTGRALNLEIWPLRQAQAELAQGTYVVNNAVSITVRGMTEGAYVKMVALETVGGTTAGDTILEGYANESGVVTGSFNFEGDIDVRTFVRSSATVIGCVQNDGGVFTNKRDDANSDKTNLLDLFADGAADMNNGDEHYFGSLQPCSGFRLDVGSANEGNYSGSIAYQYWNGAWVTLETGHDFTVLSGDEDLKTEETTEISWTPPSDWATTSVTNDGTATDLYWWRMVLTETAVTANPKAERVMLRGVTRYLPFKQDGTIQGDFTVTATWVEDSNAKP